MQGVREEVTSTCNETVIRWPLRSLLSLCIPTAIFSISHSELYSCSLHVSYWACLWCFRLHWYFGPNVSSFPYYIDSTIQVLSPSSVLLFYLRRRWSRFNEFCIFLFSFLSLSLKISIMRSVIDWFLIEVLWLWVDLKMLELQQITVMNGRLWNRNQFAASTGRHQSITKNWTHVWIWSLNFICKFSVIKNQLHLRILVAEWDEIVFPFENIRPK